MMKYENARNAVKKFCKKCERKIETTKAVKKEDEKRRCSLLSRMLLRWCEKRCGKEKKGGKKKEKKKKKRFYLE